MLLDMLNRFLFVYIDDTWIFSETLEEHIQHMLVWHLLENKPYVKAEKCEFHSTSVTSLGFIIQQGQLSLDPSKVKAMVEWPTHSSQKGAPAFPRLCQLLSLVHLGLQDGGSIPGHSDVKPQAILLDTRGQGCIHSPQVSFHLCSYFGSPGSQPSVRGGSWCFQCRRGCCS